MNLCRRHWSVLSLLACLVASCAGEDVGPEYTDCRYDIVTYMGVNNAGDEVYDLVGRDDEPSCTLYAEGVHAPAGSQAGRRLLLRYAFAAPQHGAARRINAYAASAIVSDSLRYTVRPLAHYLQDNSPVRLRSLWRTGDYINLHCQLEYTGRSRHFYLLVDSTTWHNDTVHCHLVNNVFGDTARHWRECYASFFVGQVWKQNSCRVMRLHIDDVVRPDVRCRDFIK